MFGFRRSVLEFQQAQLAINKQRHETDGHILVAMDAMETRLRFLEQRIELLEGLAYRGVRQEEANRG